jgi:excisionase family DNA binding protein
MSQFLTRTELATAMGLSTETIRRLTAAKKIPFYRIGRSYRYELEPVLDTFKNETTPADKSALLG